MKRMHYLFVIFLMWTGAVGAQELAGDRVRVDNRSILIADNGQVMIGMDITLPAAMELSSNRVATLTPILKTQDGDCNKVLPAIRVYGRTRYLVQRRERSIPADTYAVVRRKNGTEQAVNYSTRIPYEEWMNGAELELWTEVHGCADCRKEEERVFVTRANLERYVVKPVVAFVSPPAEPVKVRTEERRAYLDFPIGQTTISPDFRRNPFELAAIRHTVDLVKEDANTTITGIEIVGYASPDGAYAVNAHLARVRTEALKRYVMDAYGFEVGLFTVSSVAEDWNGLREYVAGSTLKWRESLLSIIDEGEADFDAKEARIKALDGGKAYAALLQDACPALRHSDYTVRYVVRGFDVEEAKQIIKTRPQQLSLQEMFLVARTYEEGSDEFNELFEVAVRMFPDDPTANINAAAIELRRGDLQQAARYLDRADAQAAETLNNKGIWKLLQGDLNAAEDYFRQAQAKGSVEAGANMEELDRKRKDDALFERAK